MHDVDLWLKTVIHNVGKEPALLEKDSSLILVLVTQRLGLDSCSGHSTLVDVFSIYVYCWH